MKIVVPYSSKYNKKLERKLQRKKDAAPVPKRGTYTKQCGKRMLMGLDKQEVMKKNMSCLAKGGDFWRSERCSKGKFQGGGCRKYYRARTQIRTRRV